MGRWRGPRTTICAQHRGGKVSAEMVIASVDLVTETLVLSRNSRCPVLVQRGGAIEWLEEPCDSIGIYRNTKPNIVELPLAPGADRGCIYGRHLERGPPQRRFDGCRRRGRNGWRRQSG